MAVDAKDLKILEVLRKDSRTPIREIAKATGIKPSTIHLRMQGLVKQKVIKGFTIKVDPREVDEGLEVFAYLSTDGIDPKAYDAGFIKKVIAVTGEYDTMLVMRFKDLTQFDALFGRFKETKGIKGIKTIVVTDIIKD